MPEAHPEHPVPVLCEHRPGHVAQQTHLRVVLVRRVAGAGAEHDRSVVREDALAQPRLVVPPYGHLQPARAQQVREHRREGVLPVDDQRMPVQGLGTLLHPQPERRERGAAPVERGPHPRVVGEPYARVLRAGPRRPYDTQGREHARRLRVGLRHLALRVGAPHQRRADRHPQPSVGVDVGGADQDGGVQGLRAARVPAEQGQRPPRSSRARRIRAARSPGTRSARASR
ncbi:hypothetical protein GCM10020256_57400 [Streptomyces thermocoprophilus]